MENETIQSLRFLKTDVLERWDISAYHQAHRPIIADFLSSFEGSQTKESCNLDDLLIWLLALKMRQQRLNTPGEFALRLSEELGITDTVNVLPRICFDGVKHSYQFEELVSSVIQTRAIRLEGKKNGEYRRKNNGVFYTPYSVANKIATEGLSFCSSNLRKMLQDKIDKKSKREFYEHFLKIKIIDPACGTGIILSATIDVLLAINDSLEEHLRSTDYYRRGQDFLEYVILNNIYGVDIDEKACSVTRSILNAKYLKNFVDLSNNIKCGNSLIPDNLLGKNNFSLTKEFENVFSSNKGFDVLVMNPPYDRLKVDSSDFEGIENSEVLYRNAKEEVEFLVKSLKQTGYYPLSTVGVLDSYKLFIERAINITNPQGAVSFITPLSILGDLSCRKLRNFILNNTVIESVCCIPEKARIFYNVSQAFAIMSFRKGTKGKKFSIFQEVTSMNPFEYSKKVDVSVEDIKSISPSALSIPICDKYGWDILKKMHEYENLKQIVEIKNLRGELDLTFGKKYITTDASKVLLIRGNMVESFRLKREATFKPSFVNFEQLAKDQYLGLKARYVNTDRLVGQQIANMGMRKRLKFARVDRGVVANSCNFISVVNSNCLNNYYMLALLNSALLNWRFKLTSTNNHVNNYELDELPIAKISSNKKLGDMLSTLSKEQCSQYEYQKQIRMDAIILLLYGLNFNEAKYIADSEFGPDDAKSLLKLYNNEKDSL